MSRPEELADAIIRHLGPGRIWAPCLRGKLVAAIARAADDGAERAVIRAALEVLREHTFQNVMPTAEHPNAGFRRCCQDVKQ